MVEIHPFKALRRSGESKHLNASSFICPPYDVISEQMKRDLMSRHAENVVRLELPDGEGDARYRNAAETLGRWRDDGVVQQDRFPSYYLLETAYRVEDAFAPEKQLKRYGVLVALRLEAPGKGAVRPHEKTLSKAKEDRLKLLSAVQTNISPIFGLFFDEKKAWADWVREATSNPPLVTGEESATLSHRMWKIDDAGLKERLGAMLEKRDLFIADGHHRYEVSWAYKEQRLAQEPKAERFCGWQFVMTYVCPMEEAGLLMLPTHRLVRTEKSVAEWREHLDGLFEMRTVSDVNALIEALKKTDPSTRAIGWVNAEGAVLLTLKSAISIDRCLADRPESLRSLDVVLLHDLILEESREKTYVKDQNIFFTQDVAAMREKAKADPKWNGFVLRSAGVDALAAVARAGEVMPPKTTYFYPKVPTGFTLMPVNGTIT